MHSNVTIKNVSWPHFSWPNLYFVIVFDSSVYMSETYHIYSDFLLSSLHRKMFVINLMLILA